MVAAQAEKYASNPEKFRRMAKEYAAKNVEKVKARAAKWRKENKETKKTCSARWYAENAERLRAKTKQWRLNNPEKAKALDAEQYHKNKEKNRLRCIEYREKNRDKIKARQSRYTREHLAEARAKNHNRRVRKMQNGGKLSRDIFDRLFRLQKGKCVCCGQPLGKRPHLDHILPLALGGKNEDSNVQLLTAHCNAQKFTKHPIDFMQSRGFLL